MVLHHQHDDVLDLRQQVLPGGQPRAGERSLLPGRATTRQALDLTAFEQFPHFRATLRSDVRRRGQRRSQATPLPAPAPLIRPNPTVPPRRSPPAEQLPAVQQTRAAPNGRWPVHPGLASPDPGRDKDPARRPSRPAGHPGAPPGHASARSGASQVATAPRGMCPAVPQVRRRPGYWPGGDLDGAMHAGLHGMPAVTASTRRSLDPHRQGIQ